MAHKLVFKGFKGLYCSPLFLGGVGIVRHFYGQSSQHSRRDGGSREEKGLAKQEAEGSIWAGLAVSMKWIKTWKVSREVAVESSLRTLSNSVNLSGPQSAHLWSGTIALPGPLGSINLCSMNRREAVHGIQASQKTVPLCRS